MPDARARTTGDDAPMRRAVAGAAQELVRGALVRLLAVAIAAVVIVQLACLAALARRAPERVWVDTSRLLAPLER